MPIYCDECEAVIDRDEELTRIEGNDYCLDCTPTERTEMTAPISITHADIDRATLSEMVSALLEVTDAIEAYCHDHASDNPTDVTVCLPRLRAACYRAQGISAVSVGSPIKCKSGETQPASD
jgi:hypothetical protein